MADKWIHWLEELGQEHYEIVGRKCANLGEMTKLGMKVPPGFAISTEGYRKFMELTGLKEKIQAYFATLGPELRHSVARQMDASRGTQQMIRETPVPAAISDEIVQNYRRLCEQCRMENVSVAVRSSGAVSMPGQMETYLNVQGEQDVVRRVVEVWESSFTTRAIAFRLEKSMPVDQAPIGVAVIKMVNAKSAGVALTVIPTTSDVDRVVIEGNWGLGESVVSGDITPDNFIVEKATGAIEKNVTKKTRYVIFNGTGTAKAEVPAELQDLPCLEDAEIQEIVRIALNVEKHFGVPQDMEWVLDKDLTLPDSLFWVQTRAAKYTPKKADADADYLVDQMAMLFRM
ncbi:MAG: hypothetical protein HGA98_02670 [Deltaproteobacteria bacterium]|nr:hypothetical protein [Deltaproteobacteria bacterium]